PYSSGRNRKNHRTGVAGAGWPKQTAERFDFEPVSPANGTVALAHGTAVDRLGRGMLLGQPILQAGTGAGYGNGSGTGGAEGACGFALAVAKLGMLDSVYERETASGSSWIIHGIHVRSAVALVALAG